MNNNELKHKLEELKTAKAYFDYAYNNLMQYINENEKEQ